jgi:hypothetical protein
VDVLSVDGRRGSGGLGRDESDKRGDFVTDSTPHFERNVDTRGLVHGRADREMELLSAFAFVDSTGYRWATHPGETCVVAQVVVVDG